MNEGSVKRTFHGSKKNKLQENRTANVCGDNAFSTVPIIYGVVSYEDSDGDDDD